MGAESEVNEFLKDLNDRGGKVVELKYSPCETTDEMCLLLTYEEGESQMVTGFQLKSTMIYFENRKKTPYSFIG